MYKRQLEKRNESTSGEYKGIGAKLSQDTQTGAIQVVTCFEGTPAEKAGLLPGDILSVSYTHLAMGLKAGDDDAVCANYVSAENNYKLSQNCAAPQLNGTITVSYTHLLWYCTVVQASRQT